jgi:hypothetical protein
VAVAAAVAVAVDVGVLVGVEVAVGVATFATVLTHASHVAADPVKGTGLLAGATGTNPTLGPAFPALTPIGSSDKTTATRTSFIIALSLPITASLA